MKAQTKALLASIVVIALALTAVSGVTYSWWSDSENSEITINTGMLRVDTKVTDNGGLNEIEINESLPETISIENLEPTSEDNSVVIKYEVSFYNTIAAKYLISAESNNKKIEVKLNSSDGKITFGGAGITLPTATDSTIPTLTGTVEVIITVEDFSTTQTGTINLRNEITQQGNTFLNTKQSVSTAEELKAAVENSQSSEIQIPEGSLKLPNSELGADKSFVGVSSDKSVLEWRDPTTGEGNGRYIYAEGASITMKNLTLKLGDGGYWGFARPGTLVMENCVIEGTMTIVSANALFKNCTFKPNEENEAVWSTNYTDSDSQVTFDGCTFNGGKYAIDVYSENKTNNHTLNVIGCSFNKATSGSQGSAIHIKGAENGSSVITVNIQTSGGSNDYEEYTSSSHTIVYSDTYCCILDSGPAKVTIKEDNNVKYLPS